MTALPISIADPLAFAKLGEFIRDIRLAMLTTVGGDGALHSRPMETCQLTADGALWFFVDEDSNMVREIIAEHQVCLSFVDCQRQHYVSVSGAARTERDRAKMQALWRPRLATYFPAGVDDPRLALLRVQIESTEYWDASAGRMVQLFAFTRANTDEPATLGMNGHVDLPGFKR